MNRAKKILSLCLSVLMIFTFTTVAFAAEGDNESRCPVIHIPGIDSSIIYADVNDPDSVIAIPDKEVIIDAVKDEIVPALVVYSANRDIDKLAAKISVTLNDLFADWFNNADGTAKENAGVVRNLPDASKLNSNSKLRFDYDWRSDPVVVADELNEYINYVTASSGCDKVALTCHSLGSVIALSYLTSYGDSKISAIVYDTPACNGVAVVGNLFTGKVTLDSEAISYFLKSSLGEAEYNDLVNSVLDIFDANGMSELVTVFLDEIIRELSPVLYEQTIAPLFGSWLTMWSMVPDEQLDEAMAYIFDDVLKDQDLSALRAKVELYNKNVRSSRNSTLINFDSKANFAIIARYGYPSFPLTDASSLIGDTVIETKSSSFGATTADVGDYFSDEYLAGKDEKYISPDKTIDASTCLFPEKTWFLKNTNHGETYITSKYYDALLFSSQELTCDTFELGRFTYYDRENGAFTEDTSVPEKITEPTFFERLFNFLTSFLSKIGQWLKNLIK